MPGEQADRLKAGQWIDPYGRIQEAETNPGGPSGAVSIIPGGPTDLISTGYTMMGGMPTPTYANQTAINAGVVAPSYVPPPTSAGGGLPQPNSTLGGVAAVGAGTGAGTGPGLNAAEETPASNIDFSFLQGPLANDAQFAALRDKLLGMTSYFTNAQENLQALPGNIDAWTKDLISQNRIGIDQITNTLNDVANQRSQQGILGGTESNNLRANMLSQLVKDSDEKTQAALKNAIQQKTDVISGAPRSTALPLEMLAEMYGLEAGQDKTYVDFLSDLLGNM